MKRTILTVPLAGETIAFEGLEPHPGSKTPSFFDWAFRRGRIISEIFEPELTDEEIMIALSDDSVAERRLRQHFPHVVQTKIKLDSSDELYAWTDEHITGRFGRCANWFGFDDPNDAFEFKMRWR